MAFRGKDRNEYACCFFPGTRICLLSGYGEYHDMTMLVGHYIFQNYMLGITGKPICKNNSKQIDYKKAIN